MVENKCLRFKFFFRKFDPTNAEVEARVDNDAIGDDDTRIDAVAV